MKKLFIILLTATAVSVNAQTAKWQSVSYSDPAVSNLKFTDGANAAVDMNMLTIGTAVKISFDLTNNDALNWVPAGSCKLKITLGSKFRLVNDLTTGLNLPLMDFFHWDLSSAPQATQFIITGDLYGNLPPHYSGNVSFTLMPYKEGSSTVSCQILISNHNNPVMVLSDIAPYNNFVSKSYSNVKPLGIKFTRFDAAPHGCTLELNWEVFDEEKLTRRFIIETSDDGISFQPLKTITATGASSYTLLLEGLNKSSMTVRIKDETLQGQFVYSGILFASNICNGRFELGLLPNPLPSELTEVLIQAKAGIFNGKYSLVLRDAGGKELKRSDITCTNQLEVKFNTGFITSGNYFINVTGEDGLTRGLKLLKL
jgi:hypothetical protein